MSITTWSIKPPSRSGSAPLYVQLAEAFVQYMAEHAIPANTPMPSEAELMERYGLSRITVRQAMIKLCSEGWINKIQGKGTFTATPAQRAVMPGWRLPDGSLWCEPEGIEERFLEAVDYPASFKYRQIFQLGPDEGTYRVRIGKLINGALVGLETRHFPHWVAALHKQALRGGKFEYLLRQHPDTVPVRVHYGVRTSPVSDYEMTWLGMLPDAFVFTVTSVHYNRRNIPIMSGRVVFNTTEYAVEYDIRYEDLPALSANVAMRF